LARRKRRLRRIVISCLLIAAGAYASVAALLYVLQARLVYRPSGDIHRTPADLSLPFQEVSFRAKDGVRLSAWFVPSENAGGVVLFCHGNAGNMSHRLPSVSLFHRLGLSVLIFDYRGYGRSEGRPTEEGTCLDAEAAWDYLVTAREIPPENTILFGRSLGGAVAARLATVRRPGAVVLESTFTSLPDMAAELLPWLPARWLCRFSYDTASRVGRITCPLLVVHSCEDELIPFSHGRKLFAAARGPKAFLRISGTHNDGFLTSGEQYVEGLRAFLCEHVLCGASGGRPGP
jgi:fermentation-respiration switch protein FrsA (DUF1100 family)